MIINDRCANVSFVLVASSVGDHVNQIERCRHHHCVSVGPDDK